MKECRDWVSLYMPVFTGKQSSLAGQRGAVGGRCKVSETGTALDEGLWLSARGFRVLAVIEEEGPKSPTMTNIPAWCVEPC